MKVEVDPSLAIRASLRSLLRYGLKEATALSSPDRASFKLRGPLKEPVSEHCKHGYTPYRKGFLFDTDVLWRIREAYRRHP